MLAHPKRGECVVIHYAPGYGQYMPLQDRQGAVVLVGVGRPRNHGVEVDGRVYCVPCGNLNRGKHG